VVCWFADWQPAHAADFEPLADCPSATRQVANLRYEVYGEMASRHLPCSFNDQS
jgi:hypothetical protein